MFSACFPRKNGEILQRKKLGLFIRLHIWVSGNMTVFFTLGFDFYVCNVSCGKVKRVCLTERKGEVYEFWLSFLVLMVYGIWRGYFN